MINPIIEMMIVVRIFTLYVLSQIHNIESIETDPIDINLTIKLKLYVFLIYMLKLTAPIVPINMRKMALLAI